MDAEDSDRKATQDLLAYAQSQGVVLKPLLFDIIFQRNGRSIFFVRNDSLIHYNITGPLNLIPVEPLVPGETSQKVWHESGSIEDIPAAYRLLKAWVLDTVEIEALPTERLPTHRLNPEEEAARKLVAYARSQGVELEPRYGCTFQSEGRHVFFWMKNGAIHYNMQGRVKSLPTGCPFSPEAFQGHWGEAGWFQETSGAYAFLKAWIFDLAELDDLPPRERKRWGL